MKAGLGIWDLGFAKGPFAVSVIHSLLLRTPDPESRISIQ